MSKLTLLSYHFGSRGGSFFNPFAASPNEVESTLCLLDDDVVVDEMVVPVTRPTARSSLDVNDDRRLNIVDGC
jgi:hypothetical protein